MPFPVAFAPAFVVKHTQRLANGQNRYQVAAVDPDQIEASIAVAKAHQDELLMAIEQAIDLEKKAYEKKKKRLKR